MKKGFKKFMMVAVGAILIFLGSLWFLQGAAIIQVCPILCFADCQCLTGGSLLWEIVGLIVFCIGLGIIYLGLKCGKTGKTN